MSDLLDRYRGCLFGLAAGDALGTTLEFRCPGSFEPISDIVGGGPFNLKPGQWTDDTSMALCLAQSLASCGRFDAVDQMDAYGRWARDGYMSSTGQCFDIGGTVSEALCSYSFSENPYSGPSGADRAGNGSIMRLAPIPMFYRTASALACDYAVLMSRTTHGATTCIDACHYFCDLIVQALSGVPKDDVLGPNPKRVYCSEIAEIANGSFKEKVPPQIAGTGYVVQSLEAALWAFHRSETFRDGALLAVNLGDDADTTGAVYGQIAGAFYGAAGIPENWLGLISDYTLIDSLAVKLCDLSETLDLPEHTRMYNGMVNNIVEQSDSSPFL